MIRLWLIVRWLSNYHDPAKASIQNWYQQEVSVFDFENHLTFKKRFFRESYIDSFERLLSIIGFNFSSNDRRLARARVRQKQIKESIEDVTVKGYVIKRNAGTETNSIFLKVSPSGRDFLRPLTLINSILQKNGYILAFLYGSGGTLLVIFIKNIINIITSLF